MTWLSPDLLSALATGGGPALGLSVVAIGLVGVLTAAARALHGEALAELRGIRLELARSNERLAVLLDREPRRTEIGATPGPRLVTPSANA